jgi:hypothetical protein
MGSEGRNLLYETIAAFKPVNIAMTRSALNFSDMINRARITLKTSK